MSRALIAGVACGMLASAGMAVGSYRSPEGADSPWAQPDRQAAIAMAYAPPTYRANQRTIASMVASEARRQGVDPNVAIKIAYVESRFRANARGPRTRHGRAEGVLQVLPSSAEALEPGSSRHLLNPAVGIRVGVRHMARCMEVGARTEAELARCHVAGWAGWNRALSHSAERYKQKYAAMVRAAPIGAGWIARGEGSLNVAGLN